MATVVEHTRLKKIIVFKKKRRKNYKKTQGKKEKENDKILVHIHYVIAMANVLKYGYMYLHVIDDARGTKDSAILCVCVHVCVIFCNIWGQPN